MRVRFLGHSCVEVIGQHHILIDPDFTRDPEPGVEYICITHAHKDHIGRVAEVPTGLVLAASDVCEIAAGMGVPRERLKPVVPGKQIANIQILPGYSRTNDPVYAFFYLLFRRRMPDPGGTSLSFLVKDESTLLHVGDAHEAPLPVTPDIFCLPWRKAPFQPKRYQELLIHLAVQFGAPYVLPIHHDLPHMKADPADLCGRLKAEILDGQGWHVFEHRRLVRGEK
jgi:L-ascorbate metabolism protein UlaG (beta-lactamase superfamily)